MVARTLALALALLAACAGPQPTIENARATPSALPGHVRVTGQLVNHAGHGTVELDIVLRGNSTIRHDETIDIGGHETTDLAIDIAAPAGDYTVSIEPKYPN
ncbi:MAG TPA: hypothetical protein VGC41_10970 [Kofleriaceae bacterium]